jgi:hypothetical protein
VVLASFAILPLESGLCDQKSLARDAEAPPCFSHFLPFAILASAGFFCFFFSVLGIEPRPCAYSASVF